MAKRVWYNARIVTLAPSSPRAEAMAVDGERIEYVGSAREALRRAGPGAETIDLRGRAVVPGFNDNHVHTVILGDHDAAASLVGLSAEGIVERLEPIVAKAPPGTLVWAYDWDYPACPSPDKSILDRAFPDNPLILAQFGGHGLWLNSRALSLLGIEKGRPDPKGSGVVLRRADGEPTGVVREMGNNRALARHFNRMFLRAKLALPRIERALAVYRGYGITSVQDNTWYVPVVFALKALKRQGRLSARFSCWRFGEAPGTIPLMRLPAYDREWVARGPVKYFLDGTFSTRTALLWEDYADDPGNRGRGLEAPSILRILTRLAARGNQGAFHAIGDRAVSNFLDAMEELLAARPEAARLRFRLEHAQLIRPKDVARLARLGVLVSAQPAALTTPEKDEHILGSARALAAYPHRSLLDAGVHLSFGSDIPGEPTCDPLLCVHLVANRPGPERILPEEALRCYTVGSAFAEFRENEKGTLEAGKLADFAVLSDDITRIPVERIRHARVEMTVVGGRTVYERSST